MGANSRTSSIVANVTTLVPVVGMEDHLRIVESAHVLEERRTGAGVATFEDLGERARALETSGRGWDSGRLEALVAKLDRSRDGELGVFGGLAAALRATAASGGLAALPGFGVVELLLDSCSRSSSLKYNETIEFLASGRIAACRRALRPCCHSRTDPEQEDGDSGRSVEGGEV